MEIISSTFKRIQGSTIQRSGLLLLFIFLSIAVHAQFTVTETFKGSALSGNIITGGSAILTSGNADPINDGWLRLTPAKTSQQGYAYVNSSFPSTMGVIMEFEYKTWGGNGADGFCVFLFDAATSTFKPGGYGGSLGYAPNGSTSGLSGGYLGVGFDEFGNFSNPTEGRNGGPGARSNSVTMRGPTTSDSKTTNAYIDSKQTTTLSPSYTIGSLSSTRPTDASFFRKVKITILPTGTGSYVITVYWQTSTSGSYTQILQYTTTTAPPANLKLGFSASTGGSTNYHEIRNLYITTLGNVRVQKEVDKANANVGDLVTYTVNVNNDSPAALNNVVFADTLKNGSGNNLVLGSDFNINSITFNNNGTSGTTASGFTSGTAKTGGFVNPWSTTLNMVSNSTASFTIVGTVLNQPTGNLVKNTVGIDPTPSGITDQDLTNNYSSVGTTVLTPNVDFTINKTVDSHCADATNGNIYTITVSNMGASASVNNKMVTVTDIIPAGCTVTSASGTGWTITNSGNTYTFKRSDVLASTYSYPAITIAVKPPASGISWTNSATVTSAGNEVNTTNNTSQSVVIYSTPVAPIIGAVTQPDCSVSTGSFTITNYDASYTYTVAPSTGVTVSGNKVTAPAGTYSVTASSSAGCTSPVSSSVIVTAQPLTPAAPTASVTAQPTCAVSTGTITVTAPIGAGYTYSVDGTNYQSGTIFSGLATGSYNVMVKNSDGCISAATVLTINAQPLTPAAPTANVTAQPTCAVSTGTITVTAPIDAGYTYSVDGTNYQSGTAFSGLATGSYNVTVKNSDGCISAATALTINAQPLTPAAPTTGVTAQPTCAVSTGTITVTAPIGAGYTYSVDGTNYQSGTTFSGLAAGIYNVTVKNSDGCISLSTPLTINTQPATPIVSILAVNPKCANSPSVTLVGSPVGGTFSGAGVSPSGLFSPATAGVGSHIISYSYTNSSGCTAVATTTIDVLSAPVLTIHPASQTICAGSSASMAVVGDNGGTVTWSSNYWGLTGTGTSFDTGILTNSGTASYTLNITATAVTGICQDRVVGTVTVLPEPRIIALPKLTTLCSYENLNVTLSSVIVGTSINWSIIDNTSSQTIASGTGLDNLTITNKLPAGSYSIKATGTKDGCTSRVTNVLVVVN